MAFIEKYLIYFLIAVIAVVSIFGGIQYVRVLKAQKTVAQQKDQIASLNKDKADLQGQLADAKANIEAVKTAAKIEQQISNYTADIRKKINLTQINKCIGDEDAKTIDSIVDYFNNGVRGANGDTKTDAKVLPTPDKTNPGKASAWTIPELEDILLTLVNYIGQLEQGTIQCYESNEGSK